MNPEQKAKEEFSAKSTSKSGDKYIQEASKLFNVPEDRVTTEQRLFMKTILLGVVHGMGPAKITESLNQTFTINKSKSEVERDIETT